MKSIKPPTQTRGGEIVKLRIRGCGVYHEFNTFDRYRCWESDEKGYYPYKGYEGYVYIVRSGKSRFYKIGITQNIERRLSQMQNGNPEPITLSGLYKVLATRETESYLHYALRKSVARGEWFFLDGDKLADVKEFLKGFVPYVS